MNQRLLEVQQKIDGLNQRERVLVFLMAAAAVVMFFQFFFIDSLTQKTQRYKKEIARLDADVQQIKSDVMVVNAQLTVGVNKGREAKLERLENELVTLDERIERSIVAMIPPRLMAQVLENILMQDEGLKLIAMENKPVQSIVGEEKNEGQKEGSISEGLYKHVFVLTLEGGYGAAIEYFERLAGLPWNFYWDDLRYEVIDYPKAIITLEVHTVSMSEDWIGV